MGENVAICRVRGAAELLERLLALGFTPGAMVRPAIRAPLGDPTVYRLRGYAVALGWEQAKEIEVRYRRLKQPLHQNDKDEHRQHPGEIGL